MSPNLSSPFKGLAMIVLSIFGYKISIMSNKVATQIPDYLEETYWWAYVRPWAVRFFERQWLINTILFGNYVRLRNAVLDEFGDDLAGRTLQMSCCYGDLSPRLAHRAAQNGGALDVVDILPIQLDNLRKKITPEMHARTLLMNTVALDMPEASYDRVLLFFLLHEEPQAYREKIMSEALRVLKPGGKIVIVDYAQPAKWHPVRLLIFLFLARLEPYAVDLWSKELADVIPAQMSGRVWKKTSYFGVLYQKLVSTR